MQQQFFDADIPALEEEEEKSRLFGGGGRRRTKTKMTKMTIEMATDRSGGGVTRGRGAGLLPSIDKNYNNSNMNARKRATNRSKTASKAKTKTKTGVGLKGG